MYYFYNYNIIREVVVGFNFCVDVPNDFGSKQNFNPCCCVCCMNYLLCDIRLYTNFEQHE